MVSFPSPVIRSAEIGYGVHGARRGQGYASEALGAVARWALRGGGVQRAFLTANTDNLASVRVAEKAGFRREGTLRRAAAEPDGLHDPGGVLTARRSHGSTTRREPRPAVPSGSAPLRP